MEIRIFDVAHGFCCYVVADNGNTMLVDCGHNDQTAFYPSNYLLAVGCRGINRFFVTNYDEDHVSGLPILRQFSERIPIHILHRNRSVTTDQLRALKRQGGPLGSGITALLEMMSGYVHPEVSPPEYPNLECAVFWNTYPEFKDTNNLSLVLFLHHPGISIIFPGDLERPGWRRLLEREEFRRHLQRVKIFVASHHGRIGGYSPEVFEICKPNIVIISDEAKQYETQEHAYDIYATGITWNQTNLRKVLTTRKDGMLTITNTQGGGYYISASKGGR